MKNLSLFKSGAQPWTEFNINLDRGVFAEGQRIREMHQRFIEPAVKNPFLYRYFSSAIND